MCGTQANLPLSGAVVTLAPRSEDRSSLMRYLAAISTAPAGSFGFTGLAAGTYVLQVHLAGYGFFRQEVTLNGPSPQLVEVSLAAGHAIRGQVRSADMDELLAGVLARGL